MSLFEQLSRYNGERGHGLAHHPEWVTFMARVQELWNTRETDPWASWLGRTASAQMTAAGRPFVIVEDAAGRPDWTDRAIRWLPADATATTTEPESR